MSTVDDYLNMDLTSSPIRPSHIPSGSPSIPPTSPSRSTSPIPHIELPDQLAPQSMSLTRKRPAEDDSAFIAKTARSHKLAKSDTEELTLFSKHTPGQQRVLLAASLLSIHSKLAKIDPPNAVYAVPSRLVKKMDMIMYRVLLDPSLPAYLTDEIPLKKSLALLENNTSWGLTKEVKDCENKMHTIATMMRKKFNTGRHDIKGLLISSVGNPHPDDPSRQSDSLNIVELSDSLITLNEKSVTSTSVELCARVAFLRLAASEKKNTGGSFWKILDTKLVDACKRYQTPQTISKFFGKILEDDLKKYGTVNVHQAVRDRQRDKLPRFPNGDDDEDDD
ncbi:hypothetical protein PC9H_011275 [Pleurotus ostreatus]|uniref:Uncharacterized protein n=1 Tax=Pleurotus ostreatus TaxID=5322 RepID=A0A8H6ZN84_PLEOS|nr:uncharacterized protein PC9H_011275 [Pleurotus ostreatus]KAF7420757.1 hypothetical protein PC9H_011275 [Pleurotus ostreatus]KAJ8690148.1 hypothetical protein PTI98_011606 [Pleurotus ostreatus]